MMSHQGSIRSFTARPPIALRQQSAVRRNCVRPLNAVKEIFMPALSSTMTEGKIVSWLKGPGDKVAKGESVVVVESDKADMDVESFNDGILGAIVINEGGVANVGEPIAFIAESEADLEAAKAKASGSGAAAAPAPPPEAEKIEAPKELATAAATTSEKPAAPSLPPQAAAPPPPPPPPQPVGRADGRIVATPYAKKLAQQLGVDLAQVNGSGPAGRITAQDVEGFKSNGASTSAPAAPTPSPVSSNGATPAAAPKAAAPAAAPAPPAAPSTGTSVSDLKGTTVPFTAMQSAVSKNMIESLKVPEFRVAYTIVTDKLDVLYKKLKPKGVTMTALLAKAVGIALAKHPIMYAATTKGGDGTTYSEHVNVALAVTMPDGGLITPVIKDADSTDIYQISRLWADLVKRARSKQLAPDEYNSGNFTISNLGMYGADTFDAILPPGTAGILAVAASKPTVLADDQGRLYVAKQMKVNLTADHRIIYGAAAAEFMQTLKAVIEDPDQLTF